MERLRSISNLTHMYNGATCAHADGHHLALANHYGIEVYNTRALDSRLDMRRLEPVFAISTIPLKIRVAVLEQESRISCIHLQGEYVWVGLFDNTVRVYHWPTEQELRGIRRRRERTPWRFARADEFVTVSWSNGTTTVHFITEDGVVAEAEQRYPVTDWANFQTMPYTQQGQRYNLTYSDHVFELCTRVAGDGRHLYFRVERMKIAAMTMHENSRGIAAYTAYKLEDGRTLLVYSQLDETKTAKMGLLKDELKKMVVYRDVTVYGMLMYHNMLAVVVKVAVGTFLNMFCPIRLKLLYAERLPDDVVQRPGMVILNKGLTHEALLLVCGTYRIHMTAHAWEFQRRAIGCSIACSKRRCLRLPQELWMYMKNFF